jgi:hypothetical protein
MALEAQGLILIELDLLQTLVVVWAGLVGPGRPRILRATATIQTNHFLCVEWVCTPAFHFDREARCFDSSGIKPAALTAHQGMRHARE